MPEGDAFVGRILSAAGDSVVAEFTSAVEAVRRSISTQEELRVCKAELAEGRTHRGDVNVRER